MQEVRASRPCHPDAQVGCATDQTCWYMESIRTTSCGSSCFHRSNLTGRERLETSADRGGGEADRTGTRGCNMKHVLTNTQTGSSDNRRGAETELSPLGVSRRSVSIPATPNAEKKPAGNVKREEMECDGERVGGKATHFILADNLIPLPPEYQAG